MELTYIPPEDLVKMPDTIHEPLFFNEGQALRIIDLDSLNALTSTDQLDISLTTGITTILYHWCPAALYAFLDEGHWYSVTWILTLPDDSQIQIDRIDNEITFGTIEGEEYKLMVTLKPCPTGDVKFDSEVTKRQGRDAWVLDAPGSLIGLQRHIDPVKLERLAHELIHDLLVQRRWLAGPGMKHSFFVEWPSIIHPDLDTDGFPVSPHWVYAPLDLGCCTSCSAETSEGGKALDRCGRCGTAAYCSATCQKKDWAVHKAVCTMSLEQRGQALQLSKEGGLVHHAKVAAVEDAEKTKRREEARKKVGEEI